MKYIHKIISLEQFKTRTPNTLVSFSQDKYLKPSSENFYYINPNGNYNTFPSDIKLYDSFDFTSSANTAYTVSYDFSTISGLTNTNINIKDVTKLIENIGNNEEFLHIEEIEGGKIKISGETDDFKILTYKKLHNWYKFFIFYFRLLNSTNCKESDKVYLSAEEYYYNNNDLNKTLEYYQNLDKLFIARGGKINDSGIPHCDLYDWMKNFIFLTYDIRLEKDVKQYAKEWKNCVLNVNSLMYWYSWFKERYEWFSGTTDCSEVDYSLQDKFDCCDCEEYRRLGGDTMYSFLKDNIELYYEKAKKIEEYCTFTAPINIPIQIQTYNKNIGEQSALYDEWNVGLNFNKNIGNTYHFGGETFYSKDTNDIISVQDGVYFVSGSSSTYKITEYKEELFVSGGTNNKIRTCLGEYLPTYIRSAQTEFETTTGTYAYHYDKIVFNPNTSNMCDTFDIIKPDADNHFFMIDGTIYESFKTYILIDLDNNIKYDENGNPLLIKYLEDTSFPYVTYKDKDYLGVYSDNRYLFTLKSIPKHKNDWFQMSNNEIEVVLYDGKYIEVSNDKIRISYEDSFDLTINKIDGYVFVENEEIPIVKDSNNNCYCASAYVDDNNELTYPFSGKNEITMFHKYYAKADSWDNKEKGYWINDDCTVLSYIEPYKEYNIGEVNGIVRSRLDELQDTHKTVDRIGNTINGLYCGKNSIPTDKEYLDFYYHVGNVSDLSVILNDDITKTTYYWGNLISNIKFIIYDDKGDVFIEKKVNNTDNNLNSIKEIVQEYFSGTCKNINNVSDFDKIQDSDLYDGEIIFVKQDDSILEVASTNEGEKSYTYYQYNNFIDVFNKLDVDVFCEITYNIGAIIQRKYTEKGDNYDYEKYELAEKYHKGVEYIEKFKLTLKDSLYYTDYNEFFNIKYFNLEPTETLTYYMDDVVTEDSEEFSARTAHFRMETNHNLNRDLGNNEVKYTKDVNTSLSDGRQFNFYNGLMASPTIVEEYNLGITSLRNVNDNIYINRGVNKAFDKHLKLMEVKSLEALTQYGNGFYNIINNS